LAIFVITFITFILLSFDGSITIQEVAKGVVLALAITIAAFTVERLSPVHRHWGPGKSGFAKWASIIYYILGPFAAGLYKANVDAAKRIVLGKTNPGIVRFHPKLRSEEGKAFLANSIALTTGALTVDIDEEGYFYVHWIDVESINPTEEQICGPYAKWARRIFG